MDLVQYKGPIKSGSRITVEPEMGKKYVHIGIQVPKIQSYAVPVTTVSLDGKVTTVVPDSWRETQATVDIMINNQVFNYSPSGILEFDGLSETEWDIQFLDDAPAETIIDIVRE